MTSTSDLKLGDVLTIGGLLLVLGPALLLDLPTGHDAGRWLIRHQVLVPRDHAFVSLAALGAGVDLRRLLVVLGLATVATAWSIQRRLAAKDRGGAP